MAQQTSNDSELLVVDEEGFVYSGEAIDIPLSQGNVSYITVREVFEETDQEERVDCSTVSFESAMEEERGPSHGGRVNRKWKAKKKRNVRPLSPSIDHLFSF